MDFERIQSRVGALSLVLLAVGTGAEVVRLLGSSPDGPSTLFTSFDLQADLVLFGVMFVLTLWKHRWAQVGMSLLVFCSSAIVITTNPSSSYFGLGTIVIGTLLMHRFGLLEHHFPWKLGAILAWTVGIILYSDQGVFHVPLATSVATITFVAINLAALYILFEEQIRGLMASNSLKDQVMAQQAATITRLEPLSVLGQRVAHVTHSFKNNLNQVSTALYLLEQANDPERAAAKLRDFSRTLTERIENILMISRAGTDLEPEQFDVARLLQGLQQVYLQEQSFLTRARTVLTVEGPVLLHAVRWDFILMMENILKNALEAITEKKTYGTIRIDLTQGVLTVANDGGAMPLCLQCSGNCLQCPRYGKPGQTTKALGTGHGLAQVMSTCRANGWSLRIRTEEEWTLFEIGLQHP